MPQALPPIFKSLARAITGLESDLGAYDDKEVLAISLGNGIGGLLAFALHNGSCKGVSPETTEALNGTGKAQATGDLVLNHDTRNILQLLCENGIPCLLLKGTPLSMLVYPQPYLRTRCDTDMYISPNDVDRTTETLRANDYRVYGPGNRTYSSKQFQASICSFQQVHSMFDIHYRLSNRVLFRPTLPFEECLAEKQPVPALGPAAWSLSDRDLLIHACMHRIAHGRGTERNRLVWLYDIHLLWQKMDEAKKLSFIEKALQKKVGAVCADALQICTALFKPETSIPTFIEQLGQGRRSEPTAALINASKPRWALADLLALPGFKPKLKFATELLRNR